MNQTEDENVIPFPVEPNGVTFCYHVNQKVKGETQKFVECNWIDIPKKRIPSLMERLENWTSQK